MCSSSEYVSAARMLGLAPGAVQKAGMHMDGSNCMPAEALAPPSAVYARTSFTPAHCTWPLCALVRCSLGGALATLCALDLKLNFGARDVRLYTYGSPRVGNSVFAEWFESQIEASGCRGRACLLAHRAGGWQPEGGKR